MEERWFGITAGPAMYDDSRWARILDRAAGECKRIEDSLADGPTIVVLRGAFRRISKPIQLNP
jgi:hypothetical protein